MKYDSTLKDEIINTLTAYCSEFMTECGGYPLIRTLPTNGEMFRRVKVRHKSIKDPIAIKFNDAFEEIYRNVSGRSIFCNGTHMDVTEDDDEQFYVFPVDGFKFLYNPSVEYYKEYKSMYASLKKVMPEQDCSRLLVDIIRYSYVESEETLKSALLSQKEVIVYNVPCYYAVSVARFPVYTTLLSLIWG